MQSVNTPILRDIVLVGGGHAHVFVIKRFAMQPVPGVRVTLVSPDAHTPYSGMLPGLIAGHYSYDEAHIDLVRLCRYANVRFFRDTVTRLDPEARQVHCLNRPPIGYDRLSIDIGSTPAPELVPGAEGNVIAVKPVDGFLKQWNRLKDRTLERPDRTIAVVGAGAGGVELALSIQYALDQKLAAEGNSTRPTFHLVTGSTAILPGHNARVRTSFERTLRDRNIQIHPGFYVERVSTGRLHGASSDLACDDIVWVTGATPAAWISEAGLAVDARGFMLLDNRLRSRSHRDVFGAGDIGTIAEAPRPKAGVFAVRQGPVLADNLRWSVMDRPLARYRPQKNYLSLISTGNAYAVASRGRWSTEGEWVWRWKDWIDRRFMTTFNDLPEPTDDVEIDPLSGIGTPHELERLGGAGMRCGGCGAKVGASVLGDALSHLTPVAKPGILVGLDAPDDAAVFTVPEGQALVQTVDAFRAMIDDPFVFGQITANHCLGDVFAMGASPHSALAIATLPHALPEKSAALLSELMAGANAVLSAAGCAVIGGHTGEGPELSFGLAINGLISPDALMRKRGIAPGSSLILTKALGSGIVFAAHMRHRAKGRWVDAAIANAIQSNRDAARILRAHGATAMTDVTGFGLLGHLNEMLGAPATAGINLDPGALPVLAGAEELAALGIVSTMDTANRDAMGTIANLADARNAQRLPLLTDPQTGGGLLASIPAPATEACVSALVEAGYRSAGRIAISVPISDPGRPIRLTS